MRLRDLDLNLLVIFHQIVVDKSVSGAAENLGISQPAVSNALKRLRAAFNDELFVRTRYGMQPTPYASLLVEPIAQTIDLLNTAINQQDSFDPLKSKKCFYVAMTDIGDIYFLPRLIDTLLTQYPGISVKTLRSHAGLATSLAEGEIDLAIGLHPELQAGFYQRRLFHHRYVCLCRKDHPLIRLPITRENFCHYGHIKITSPGTGHGEIDTIMQHAGLERDIRLEIPHFIAVAHILQNTDLVATVPERFALSCLGPFNLRSLPLPIDLPEIAINLFWHSKYHRDPANKWFRQLIFELFVD
ncbi:LysR family transcriptional regulator [Paenalcaligenes hominis]|uniref:DNA-binding transcriptional LysR family regulator n=1 Tax=Paenalcaligenes hominis TaxID=643674 RepID=A0ABX0WTB2_9BURK|nr:LysR family transcriptional regulator [Paenalcaligenes hominis]NJB66004.1 DNA-binding transcriptional LysR family regulator [Paenalcaligenes hominis]GGE71343.1 LysR family transcriptional regulator [Paenalcaligenes hominis]